MSEIAFHNRVIPRRKIIILMISAVSFAPVAMGAANAPAGIDAISRGLNSHNQAERNAAVEKIRAMMQSNPAHAAGPLASHWIKPLRRDRRYKELNEWCLKGTCVQADPPLTMAQMEFLQEGRIKALLDLAETKEALSAAKSLYNFCRMEKTARAIQLVSKCLAADPATASLVAKFQAEQTAGASATTQSADPASGAGQEESVLKSIHVDPKPYEASIAREAGGDYHSLLRKGNRLLLADKPAEAQKAFEAACKLATPQQLPGAVESVARAIRAEDGTIGRANQYLVEHYPAAKQGG